MKRDLVLLVDADADSGAVVLEAAAETGHGVRLVKTSRDAFRILNSEIEQLGAVIIDVDPGTHGLALLEAISGRDEKPAVIVLTALEEIYMKPIATRHGAAACMGKPVSIEKLKSKLEQIPRVVAKKQGCSCDPWGHPCERHSAILETSGNYLGACHETSSRGDLLHAELLPRDNKRSHASSVGT